MFDSGDWNVDSKAASLDSSLFGPVTPKSNKKKKTKTADQPNKGKQKVNLKRKALNEEDNDKRDGKKSKKGLTDKSNLPSHDDKLDKNSQTGGTGKRADLHNKGKLKQRSMKQKDSAVEQETKNESTADGEEMKQISENNSKKNKNNRKRKIDDLETSNDKTDMDKEKAEKPELGEEKKLSIAERKRRKRKKEKERKKRKLQNAFENSSPKKAKLDESSSSDKKETGQISRKEKRNKRKKNNSKKNKFANLSLQKKDASTNVQDKNVVITENVANKGTTVSVIENKSQNSLEPNKKKRKGQKSKTDARNLSTEKSHIAGPASKTPSKQKFDLTKLKEVLSTSEKKIKVITDELEVRCKKHLDRSEDDLKEDNREKTNKSKNKKNKSTPDKNQSAKKQGIESKGQEKTLKERMQDQLNAARFRYLNEQLYTTTGAEASDLFAEDDDAFHVYHQGYQTQVSKWPVDPFNIIIKQIKARCKASKTVIADMGCGSARLAESLPGFKVHSFDFVSANERVTACDMSDVPLKDGSVDVVVFCLSLMGTNLVEYILEANRILKPGGAMKVAEVESRFKKVGAFVSKVEKLGFEIVIKDLTNKMFYLFDFKKDGDVKSSASNPKIELDPCIYKKR